MATISERFYNLLQQQLPLKDAPLLPPPNDQKIDYRQALLSHVAAYAEPKYGPKGAEILVDKIRTRLDASKAFDRDQINVDKLEVVINDAKTAFEIERLVSMFLTKLVLGGDYGQEWLNETRALVEKLASLEVSNRILVETIEKKLSSQNLTYLSRANQCYSKFCTAVTAQRAPGAQPTPITLEIFGETLRNALHSLIAQFTPGTLEIFGETLGNALHSSARALKYRTLESIKAASEPSDKVDAFFLILGDEDPDVRRAAVHFLAETLRTFESDWKLSIREQFARLELVHPLLKDTDRSVRRATAEVLGKLAKGFENLVSPEHLHFIQALQNPEVEKVVYHALDELLKAGPPSDGRLKTIETFVGELLESVGKSTNDSQAAAKALDWLGYNFPDQIVPCLVTLLGQQNQTVAQTARQTLSKLSKRCPEPVAYALIVALLNNKSVHAYIVREILGQIANKAEKELASNIKYHLRCYARAFADW